MLVYNRGGRLFSRSVPYYENEELSKLCVEQLDYMVKLGILKKWNVLNTSVIHTRKLYTETRFLQDTQYFVGYSFNLSNEVFDELYLVLLRDEKTPAHIVIRFNPNFKYSQQSIQPYTAAVTYCKWLGIWDEAYATVTVMNDNFCEIKFPSLTISTNVLDADIEFLIRANGSQVIDIEEYWYGYYGSMSYGGCGLYGSVQLL